MKKNRFKNKKRIVVKIGSSSLQHKKTGQLDFIKLEKLVRELCDLKNQDIDVCLVSSGAIAVGRKMLGITKRPKNLSTKQACAAVGQASLMMTYQKLFAEYHQQCGQVLMTKKTMIDNVSRKNAQNTFEELFRLGVILLSDIDGLFTADPKTDPEAKLVDVVEQLDEKYLHMASSKAGSDVGTGGMTTKLNAARIATYSGADMIIANGKEVGVLHQILEDDFVGTVFKADKKDDFFIADFIEENMN